MVFLATIGIIILAIGLMFLSAFPLMWLWNWLMPEIFGLINIGYWQAFGLGLLSWFFFGNKNIDFKLK